jgi:WD40 repeat protein
MRALAVFILGLMLLSACLQGGEIKPKKEEAAAPPGEMPKTPVEIKKVPPPAATLSFKPLWNFTTGDDVYGVSLSSRGTRAAVGSWDGNLYLLNGRGEELWRHDLGGSVHDVAMSPEGEYVAAVSYIYDETTVHLFTREGRELWSLRIPMLARGVDVDHDGRVAVASYQGRIYLLGEGNLLWNYTLEKSAYGAWDVVFAGDRIVAGDDNADIYVLSMEGEALSKTKVAARDYIYGVSATSAGYIAAATQNRGVYLYKDGKMKWRKETGFSNYAVAISRDSELVAVGSWDKNLYIYSIEGELLLKHPVGDNVNRLAFSGGRLIYGSSDGRAYVAEARLIRES